MFLVMENTYNLAVDQPAQQQVQLHGGQRWQPAQEYRALWQAVPALQQQGSLHQGCHR